MTLYLVRLIIANFATTLLLFNKQTVALQCWACQSGFNKKCATADFSLFEAPAYQATCPYGCEIIQYINGVGPPQIERKCALEQHTREFCDMKELVSFGVKTAVVTCQCTTDLCHFNNAITSEYDVFTRGPGAVFTRCWTCTTSDTEKCTELTFTGEEGVNYQNRFCAYGCTTQTSQGGGIAAVSRTCKLTEEEVGCSSITWNHPEYKVNINITTCHCHADLCRHPDEDLEKDLVCWSCDSQSSKCVDNFRYDREKDFSVQRHQCKSCKKVKALNANGEVLWLQRDCLHTVPFSTGCLEVPVQQEGVSGSIVTCYCHDRFCNTAVTPSRPPPPLLTALLSVLALTNLTPSISIHYDAY